MSLLPLTDLAATEAFLAAPGPRWVLKHSNACPTSFAALAQVEAHLAAQPLAAGIVVVQEARPVSTWLAQRLGRVHQSPQLFLLEDGAVRWMATHWSITAEAMAAACKG